MAIIVCNLNIESPCNQNDYCICRGYSILGNPFTHIKDRKTLTQFVVGSRDEAIDRYSEFFDKMYQENDEFRNLVDEIYQKYKRGENIRLFCWCAPLRCHGDIIKDKLQKRAIKEKLSELSPKRSCIPE